MNKKITFLKMQEIGVVSVFFSQFLFLVSIGNVGSLPLNVPFVTLAAFILLSAVGLICGKIHLSSSRVVFFLILSLTAVCSCFGNGFSTNLKSMALFIMHCSSFCLLDNRIQIRNCNRLLTIFTVLITIFSAYGIYQFIAQNYLNSLPLKELIPDFLWTKGYNTVQNTHGLLFGKSIIKPHSIYSEASNLSKYASIGIALSLERETSFKPINRVICIILNVVAMALTLSGSGIILLAIVLLFRLITASGKGRAAALATVLLCFSLYFMFRNTEIGVYYISRLEEFTTSGTSGYYRFVLPFKIGIEGVPTHFFGYGIGNDDIALLIYGAGETTIGNGFGKAFVEMGLIGLVEMICLFVFILPKQKDQRVKWSLFAICLSLNIMGSYMTTLLWCNYLFLLSTLGTGFFWRTDNECQRSFA